MDSKFKIEKGHFIKYVNHKKIAYDKIYRPAKDPPDLVIFINGLKIGVEHTRIKNSIQASNEAYLNRICKECQDKLSSIYPDPISVNCKFINHLELNNSERNKLTDTLVNLVINELTNKSKGFQNSITIAKENLPTGVKELRVHPKVQGRSKTRWTRSKFWTCGVLKKSELLNNIEKKHYKVSSIVGNYDQLWLFLVIIGERSSDFANIKVDNFHFKKDWNFDKIILMHIDEEVSWEVDKH